MSTKTYTAFWENLFVTPAIYNHQKLSIMNMFERVLNIINFIDFHFNKVRAGTLQHAICTTAESIIF